MLWFTMSCVSIRLGGSCFYVFSVSIPLCPEVVVLVRVPSMGQIDLFKDHLHSIEL